MFGNAIVDLFVGENNLIRFYKIDEEKRGFKEVKVISGKYNSYLYEPTLQVLVGFPVGDCRSVHTFLFDDESRGKKYFKGP